MLAVLFSTLFLNIFAFFNLLGIRKELIGNQLLFLLIAIGIFFLARKLGLNFFRNNAKFFYWVFVFILILTFVIGIEVKGSRRWIDLYFFNFQPSEFFKIFFIIFIADYFTRHRKDIENFLVFLKSIGYLLLPLFIIFKQPDLGNTIVFISIFTVIALFSTTPKKYIVYSVLVLLLVLPLGWFTFKEYQRNRIVSFFNPEIDQQGINYNMIQAIITVGSGKFFGRGLGYGTQSNLFFLPENHTDFAFSSLVEQFGFLGGICVLIFYFLISLGLIKKMAPYFQATDENSLFKRLFLLGFFTYFTFQVFLNIGMNLGVLPIAGVALPLISYGGSSLVSFMLGLALIL